MGYQAIFKRADDGTIWGYAPELPGTSGSGDTLDEARASLAAAIRLWLDVARERGERIPQTATVAIEMLDVAS